MLLDQSYRRMHWERRLLAVNFARGLPCRNRSIHKTPACGLLEFLNKHFIINPGQPYAGLGAESVLTTCVHLLGASMIYRLLLR